MNINVLVKESLFSKSSLKQNKVSGRIIICNYPEEIKRFFKPSELKYRQLFLFEVPKEISARNCGALEFYSTDLILTDKNVSLNINDSINLSLEAERSVNNLFDMIKTDLHDKSNKYQVGKYSGIGDFGYYSRQMKFTFTSSILKGTYVLESVKYLDKYKLTRIK